MTTKPLRTDRAAKRYDTKAREVWIELSDKLPKVSGLCVDVVIDATSSTLSCRLPHRINLVDQTTPLAVPGRSCSTQREERGRGTRPLVTSAR